MVVQSANSLLDFNERNTDISEHGIIGNCRTAALVSTNGTIASLCLPFFDSPR